MEQQFCKSNMIIFAVWEPWSHTSSTTKSYSWLAGKLVDWWTGKLVDWLTGKLASWWAGRQAGRQAYRWIGRQAGRQAGMQACRQVADRQGLQFFHTKKVIASDLQNHCSEELSTVPWCFLLSFIS